MSMGARILVVDDEPILRRLIRDRMQFWGCTIVEAGSGEEALEYLRRSSFDLVLLDLKMAGLGGLQTLAKMRERADDTDVVVLTAHGSIESAVEAIQLGAADFLLKPADFEILRNTVQRVLDTRRLTRANEVLVEQRSEDAPFVIGESTSMRKLVDEATRAAKSNATILLRGESGTGKGVIAEHIHRESGRAAGPYVYINCVALSNELIESTLFGHEKGAFTGAVARKVGRFESAAGGTAFLDEIGDISEQLQTKLLHFLESGEFERVGGTQTLHVNTRIVAATNRDLELAVQKGTFREDLLYRLNVIGLYVPPLRQRREDVLTLAHDFLKRFGRELQRPGLEFTAETEAILRAYDWPGNVRQMKNAIERVVVMATCEKLTPDLLPPEVLGTGGAGSEQSFGEEGIIPLREAEIEFRRRHLLRALAATEGNQTRAAELLGIQRSSLNRQMKELGLREPQ